jgi:uncharacterized phosphosugar-binding protein
MNTIEPRNDPAAGFFQAANGLLEALRNDEKDNIRHAARLFVEQIKNDRLIHVFGVGGHSVIGCEEFFWRAGGLANINPLFDHSLILAGGGRKSTMLERVPGIGDKVVAAQNLGKGDLLVITSIYGMNAATIDAALEAKRRETTVVAITSRAHALATPPDFAARHPSRKNLFDLADVVIDNHVPHGDTVVELDGFPQKIGSVSTMLVSACIQWLLIETVRQCGAAHVAVPIWQSANVVGGDERNTDYMNRYAPRVKAL